MKKMAVEIITCIAIIFACIGGSFALDEGELLPTHGRIVQAEEQKFHAAMEVWYKHKYDEGVVLLEEFAC